MKKSVSSESNKDRLCLVLGDIEARLFKFHSFRYTTGLGSGGLGYTE
jgi:hypothetical protein